MRQDENVMDRDHGTPALQDGVRIDARQVSVRYGRHLAVNCVTCRMRAGRITGIIGPSGCGKTSFLGCINRLTDMVPGCVVSGSIHFDGFDILDERHNVVDLRRRVGMIFQSPNPFPMPIRRNIELPLQEIGVSSREQRAEILESVLRDVGLWAEVKDRLNASAAGLSGGQKQRLCIARALALKPDVLLMDEPCSALDPIASSVVEELILQLRQRFTIVLVTHNLQQARRLADDVAVFWMGREGGECVESGSCEQIFDSPRESITQSYVSGARG